MTTRFLKTIGMVSLALCATTFALAQQAQPSASDPASAPRSSDAQLWLATGPIPPQALLATAMEIARRVDIDDQHALWATASPAVRAKVAAPAFARGTLRMRQGLGAVRTRVWVSMRLQMATASDETPAGLYATCEFMTQFAAGALKRETVSLRLDEDQTWRLAGYAVH